MPVTFSNIYFTARKAELFEPFTEGKISRFEMELLMRKSISLILLALLLSSFTTNSEADPDIFLKAVIDKTEVYPNEQILLKYDLYTRYDTRYENFEKEGRFRGFWLEYKETDKNVLSETVEYEGKKFIKATIREIALFPIASGKYIVEPGIVRVSIAKESGEREEMLLKAESFEIVAKDFPPNYGSSLPSPFLKNFPEFNNQITPVFQDGKPGLLILLDVSSSMLAEDFKPKNRLEAAKNALSEFIKAKPNMRIGVTAFAREVMTVTPLEDATKNLLVDLSRTQVGMLRDGTALGDAILEGVTELRKNEAPKNIIVLLSDGSNNTGHLDPLTAADFARQDNIIIYSISLGRHGLVPFPVDDPIFGKRYVEAEVHVDDETLREIANVTGGKFFKVEHEDQLRSAFEDIEVLSNVQKEPTVKRL